MIWLLPNAWAEGWVWPWPCHLPQWLPHGQEGFLGGSTADRMDVVLSKATPRGHPPLAWLPSTSGLHAAGVSGYLGHLPLRSGLHCLWAWVALLDGTGISLTRLFWKVCWGPGPPCAGSSLVNPASPPAVSPSLLWVCLARLLTESQQVLQSSPPCWPLRKVRPRIHCQGFDMTH